MAQLRSRKLAAVLGAMLGIGGVAVLEATWGLPDPQYYILAFLTLAGAQNVVQGAIDLRSGGK